MQLTGARVHVATAQKEVAGAIDNSTCAQEVWTKTKLEIAIVVQTLFCSRAQRGCVPSINLVPRTLFVRTVRKCNSDGTPRMDPDGCAFWVDPSFEGSSAEGREVAQRETDSSGRAREGSPTSTWPASGAGEDQSRGVEGEREEAGRPFGSRGRCHDCERDRREISRGRNLEGVSIEGHTKRRGASSQ